MSESQEVSVASGAPDKWQRDVLEKLAFAAVREQRRTRIWNLVFRFAFLAYLIAVPLLYFPFDWLGEEAAESHTALVEVNGLIAAGSDASADRIVGGLRAAFKDENTKAVVLRINSPGGSPVQSGYVNDEIRRLREKHPEVPVYAVIADIAASGAYYVAAAADEVYADKASMVGSIGVLLNGFGFMESMDKLGVERRLLTAGEHKALLDPFSAVDEVQVEHIQGLIDQIHAQFIAVVKEGRGDRLGDDPALFSGLVWSGEESLRLGLVDALGSSSYVAREVVGAEKIVDFTPQKSRLDALVDRLGVSIAKQLRLDVTGLDSGGWWPQLR